MNIFPSWALPLNIFQLHGNMCCSTMKKHYFEKIFVSNIFCYDARSISDANVLLLWGSLSKKLWTLTYANVNSMLTNRAIIHLQGCVNFENESSNTIRETLPITSFFAGCSLSKNDVARLLSEARKCLKA